jgi:hypothetical protein
MWMIEVVRGVVSHPDSFHDATRPLVLWNRERDELIEGQIAERDVQDGQSGFGCVSVSPMFRGEPPANLHTA